LIQSDSYVYVSEEVGIVNTLSLAAGTAMVSSGAGIVPGTVLLVDTYADMETGHTALGAATEWASGSEEAVVGVDYAYNLWNFLKSGGQLVVNGVDIYWVLLISLTSWLEIFLVLLHIPMALIKLVLHH
jgi:hypothetical protein